MSNPDIIHGISSLHAMVNACRTLKRDTDDQAKLEAASAQLAEDIFESNPAFCQASSIDNDSLDPGFEIGLCHIDFEDLSVLKQTVQRHIPQLMTGSELRMPVRIHPAKPFTMLLETRDAYDAAAELAQNLLIEALKNNQRMNFRCVDLAAGGSFFSSVYSLVASLPKLTGGKVFSKLDDLSLVIQDLEDASVHSMTKLGGSCASVTAYNSSQQEQLPEYICLLRLESGIPYSKELERLRILIGNNQQVGMSFVLICDPDLADFFREIVEFPFFLSGQEYLLGRGLSVPMKPQLPATNFGVLTEELRRTMQEAATIDTLAENHPELQTECFSMVSQEGIRIPFSLDDFNRLQYFEIGGDAPPHALIAGSTGSGKSSVLHNLIIQTIHNYHPDDVEIWAIDYKAVEFNFYIHHPTPHFRIIAHDTSTEFSLSLIDMLYEEYERRRDAFVAAQVQSIGHYRQKFGPRSMPRILVLIDEFQHMTQAVINYNGNTDYKIRLENLLKLTRAMGISFIFSSQTIASGLSGLSDAARAQIATRICLKHEDAEEIRETLMLSSQESDILYEAKQLKRGDGIYKRTLASHEHSADGKGYEFIHSHILFFSETIREKMLTTILERLGGDYQPKDVIIVRDSGRIALKEKIRHPIQRFISGNYTPNSSTLEWYPAAPASLADSFCIPLDDSAGTNILLIGEHDDLRKSIVLFSVCGFLMNPDDRVIVNLLDERNADRRDVAELLRNIRDPRLSLRVGLDRVLESVQSLQTIRPGHGGRTIHLWYGLDKMKNELFLRKQDAANNTSSSVAPAARDLPPAAKDTSSRLDELMDFLKSSPMYESQKETPTSMTAEELPDFETCRSILRTAFEVGPENGIYNMVIYNNYKAMAKSGFISTSEFDHKIATNMTTEDSYSLFGSSAAIRKADDNTVVYNNGGANFVPLRPYRLPEEEWFRAFNCRLQEL